MRTGLVQLPVPDAGGSSVRANVPLAPAYLKAYACAAGGFSPDDISILDHDTADWGGDAAVERWIHAGGFSVVGFSIYLWNLDRVRLIARRVKESAPSTIVVGGGPEVVAGQPLLEDPFFDAFVEGEGEAAFLELLRDAAAGGRLPRRVYRAAAPIDLATVPNPYLSGTIPFRKDEAVHLETVRGCPNRCTYCYYGKSYAGIRSFPEASTEAVVRRANEAGVPEIYLMDPSFNATARLGERLGNIARWNAGNVPIHSEIRLESVTGEVAAAYREAGFASVEVGLQSVNARSLAAVGRGWDRERFCRGAELLQAEGITVKTGVILGLPYETLASFGETLTFLRDLGLSDDAEVYPLSLLPGTVLRADAGRYGIVSMAHPPYWVLKTRDMDENDLFNATIAMESEWGVEFYEPVMPHFRERYGGFIALLDLRTADGRPSGRAADFILAHPEALANTVTILSDGSPERNEEQRLVNLGRFIRDTNPSVLVQLVFCSNGPLPSRDRCLRIAEAFYAGEHVYDLSHYYNTEFQERFSTRIFLLTENTGTARAALDCAEPWFDLVVKYRPGMIEEAPELFMTVPILRLATGDLEFGELRKVMAAYSGYENLIIEQQDAT